MLNVPSWRVAASLLMGSLFLVPVVADASNVADKRAPRAEPSGKKPVVGMEDIGSGVVRKTATPASAEVVIRSALANVDRGMTEVLIRTSAWDASDPAEPPRTSGNGSEAEPTKNRRSNKSRKHNTSHGADSIGWGYAAHNGPAAWGNLSPEFRTCRVGTMQSPVDIWSADARFSADAPLGFGYDTVGVRLADEPVRQLKVLTQAGSVMTARGVSYYLESIEFRLPGEGRVDGITPVMSVYLTHRAADGKYAIVSVPILVAGEGNLAMERLWKVVQGEVAHAALNPRDFLPREQDFFHYTGSLTQPPCTEGVAWFVMRKPVSISRQQFLAYNRGFNPNARPIQPRERPVEVTYAP